MAKGAFKIHEEPFHIEPLPEITRIPEDQWKLNQAIYFAVNVLYQMREAKAFKDNEVGPSYDHFYGRLVEAARAGLEGKNAFTKECAAALEQIKGDIVRRKGRGIKYSYLVKLAFWGVVGIVLGAAMIVVAQESGISALVGYGWVVMGSMAGAWMSVAATRRQICFEDIPTLLDTRLEPIIRMAFVALLSSILALALELNVISVKVASLDFSQFATNTGAAIFLGVAAGISERAVSVRLIQRAGELLAPTSS